MNDSRLPSALLTTLVLILHSDLLHASHGSPNLVVKDIQEVSLENSDDSLELLLYRPKGAMDFGPAVILIPGLMADPEQYEHYSQELAELGIIVAVHTWYSPLTSDMMLARHVIMMRDWLIDQQKVNPRRIGILGHSMGAKDGILAAIQFGGINSVVAIDPDDNGELSVAKHYVDRLKVPLLLIGAEVSWKGPDICAPKQYNYERFFEHAPKGTVELTLREADHVQMLEDPEQFGYTICRVGKADSKDVHSLSLRAVMGFFSEHLLDKPSTLKRLPKEFVRVR